MVGTGASVRQQPPDAADQTTQLALLAQQGDASAMAAFVRATQADVWRLCAYLADKESADDLTQDTYLRAFRSLPTFRGDSSVRSWLMTVARRVVADEITRRQRHRSVFADADVAAQPEPVAADHADAHGVQALLAHIDQDRRTAFVLTQLLGYSYAEAAQISGCPVGTIRSRVARAREDLLPLVSERQLAG